MVEMEEEDFGYMDMMENLRNSKIYILLLQQIVLCGTLNLSNNQFYGIEKYSNGKTKIKDQIENCLLGQFKLADTVVC